MILYVEYKKICTKYKEFQRRITREFKSIFS